MKIDGISFNQAWAQSKSEKEFIEQHIHAFDDSTHPISRMNQTDRRKFLRNAYSLLTGKAETPVKEEQPAIDHGDAQSIDTNL